MWASPENNPAQVVEREDLGYFMISPNLDPFSVQNGYRVKTSMPLLPLLTYTLYLFRVLRYMVDEGFKL